MDHVPQAVFWKDENLVYLGCNRQFAQDAGLSPREIIGKTALDMPWAGHASFYHADDRDVMESDAPKLNIEEPLTKADGSMSWLSTNKIPLHDGAGRVVGVLATYEDITERKRMEQYVLRTERLAAMGRLAAALAHEINNPLHAIENSLELVLDFPLTEQRRQEYLSAVRREIERLMSLTHRILDFARPPRSEQPFTPTPVAEAIRHALSLAEKELQHSRIDVVTVLRFWYHAITWRRSFST
jgi:PAS domain S-box-containing protein